MSEPIPEIPTEASQPESKEEVPVPVADPIPEIPKPPFNYLLGIDFGTSKIVTSFLKHSDLFPSIVRTDTQELYIKHLLSFKGEERLIGEAAVGSSNINPKSCVQRLNRVLGKQNKSDLDPQAPLQLSLTEKDGQLAFEIPYSGDLCYFKPELLAAILLRKVQKNVDRISKTDEILDCFFVIPSGYHQKEIQALLDAASIARFRVHGFVSGSSAITAAYGIKQLEKLTTKEETNHVIFVDMGVSEFTLTLSKFSSEGAEVLNVQNTLVGGQNFDNALFRHVQEHVKTHHPSLELTDRFIRRIYGAIDRSKCVLSTINNADIDFCVGEQDVKVSVTRSKFEDLCKADLELVVKAIHDFKAAIGDVHVDAVQVVGGSARVPMVIAALQKSFGMNLSHSLDSDTDLAVGAAAWGASKTTGFSVKLTTKDLHPIDNVQNALSQDQIQELIKQDEEMEQKDAKITLRANLKNNLETYCYGMTNNLSDAKYKEFLPDSYKKSQFEDLVGAELLWVDSQSDSDLTIEVLQGRISTLEREAKELVPQLVEKLEQIAAEQALKENTPVEITPSEPSEKKPKTNKQKLEVANDKKQLGNKHVVDLDYVSAIKLYTQALELCKSLYDETPEQRTEADALKLACYLNIAQCFLKVKVYNKAIDNCDCALSLDADSTKALFRRATAYFLTNEYDLAQPDLVRAAQLAPEDKAIKAQLQKNEAQIQRQKEQQQKMYARMFS